MKVNDTRDGHIEERFRFVCKANIADSNMLRISHAKSEVRICSSVNSEDCLKPGEASNQRGYKRMVSDPLNKVLGKMCKNHCSSGNDDGNNDIDNEVPSGESELERKEEATNEIGFVRDKSNGHSKRHVPDIAGESRVVAPVMHTHKELFRGFCGCRDLGMLRMCRRCITYRGKR